jgi:hypothetical protein
MGSFMKGLVSRIFGGRASSVMQCLIESGEVDQEELAEIRELLNEYESGKQKPEKRKKNA